MKKRLILCIVFIIMICVGTRIRFYKIDNQNLILFKKSSIHGSGSARADIIADFEKNGKETERLEPIRYIGSNTKGDYYLCEYVEADGTVTTYYAFDDNDLNSGIGAKVFWN